MSKVYTVIYTDFGDSCDGFARIFGTYKTKEEATHKMNADIADYRKDCGQPITIERDDQVLIGDEYAGCQWQILEVEVPNE